MKNMRKVVQELLEDSLTPGEVLRGARIEAGVSQEDLEHITGIARTNISALENGRSAMTSHYALLLSAALGVHPAEILFPQGRYEKTKQMRDIEKRAIELKRKILKQAK